ncbi:MAG: T9SS type A sorting domain-containing protein [Saprospiraceae bacterium]|nr:T9SS type A sorting domain-containing protein [Saprospiraceae bacterium]MCB0625268.1 T9SS type A sorting domain-containing protein [Saprospiraceae bacterium]MCB0680349.1 T9SS type A sorting domain-containing protein [Saprospiraceae bacterium]
MSPKPHPLALSDMIPKKIQVVVLFLFLGVSSEAQATFNKRIHFGFPASVLTSVCPTDTAYYVTGIVADSVFPYKPSCLFGRFDLEGNLVFSKTLASANRSFETWENTLMPEANGGFVVSGYIYDTLMRALLIRFDSEGDTLFTKQYFNPNYPKTDFLRPMDMKPTPDGGYVLTNWYGTPTLGNTDVSVLKIDSLGNEEWHKVYGDDWRERPQTILIGPNGDIIVGAIRGNHNYVNENYVLRTWIFGLDSQGNELWTYLSPSLRDAANDMVYLKDDGLLIASGVGGEVERPSVNEVYFEKSVIRLNSNLQVAWEKEFLGNYFPSLARTTNIISLKEKNKFLVAGTSVDVDYIEEKYSQKGWIHKFDINGDSIWTREYVFLENENNEHTIHDINETSDRGLIIVGEIFDLTYEDTIPQQAWILKVDEYGCLVPGCELVGTIESGEPELEIALYPNPASDYLNFFIRGITAQGKVRILDLSGRSMSEFEVFSAGQTFIFPVSTYPKGIYLLQFVEKGKVKVLASKTFVVQ